MDRVLDLHLRGPARETGPDPVFQRGSRPRRQPYGRRDGQDHRLSVRNELAESGLQTANKAQRDPVEAQARLREAAPFGAPSLDRCDLDGNALSGDRQISAGRAVAPLFPRRGEMPGHSLDGRLLPLPQRGHAPSPSAPPPRSAQSCRRAPGRQGRALSGAGRGADPCTEMLATDLHARPTRLTPPPPRATASAFKVLRPALILRTTHVHSSGLPRRSKQRIWLDRRVAQYRMSPALGSGPLPRRHDQSTSVEWEGSFRLFGPFAGSNAWHQCDNKHFTGEAS